MPKVKCKDCIRIRPFHKGEAMSYGQCPIMNSIHKKRVLLNIHKPKRCKYFKKGRSKFSYPDNVNKRGEEGIYGK